MVPKVPQIRVDCSISLADEEKQQGAKNDPPSAAQVKWNMPLLA